MPFESNFFQSPHSEPEQKHLPKDPYDSETPEEVEQQEQNEWGLDSQGNLTPRLRTEVHTMVDEQITKWRSEAKFQQDISPEE